MVIRFAKHANRPPTLNCVRDDGSETWFTASAANGDYFVAHDLLHYAVEATLGYTNAFYGMVATGRDLNDFGGAEGVPDERGYTAEAPAEALDTERLVGLVQTMSSAGSPPSYAAVHEAWTTAVDDRGSPLPPVSEDQLADICKVWGRLVRHWQSIDVPGAVELTFPKPSP
jgi:hypothetical protein